MTYYIVAILTFISFIIYDINSIRFNNQYLNKLFLIGVFVFVIENIILIFTLKENVIYNMSNLILILFSLIFFSLLIYTLFFALPFQETYIRDENKNKVIKTGMYGLSRHIGVLWFILMYIFLVFIFKSEFYTRFAILCCSLNVIYVIFQDNYTFLYLFEDYKEYKEEVPFIIPTITSIKKAYEKRVKNEF